MRGWRGAAVTALMAAIVTVLIGGPRTAYAAERAAGTEERPCPVAVPAGTTCGYLLVPERRDVPGSRTIRVGYAVHRSTSPQRRPDPVAYSSGGPGSPSLRLAGFLTQMFPDRDVVVIEQRGSRYSEPSLACPEVVGGLIETLKTPTATTEETAPVLQGALTCQSRYQAEGIDLRGYRTEEIAADVADLRAALGYEQWNLMGVSYSTRSMAEAAAKDPRGTRALVLDSFLPAQVNWYDTAAPDLRATLAKLGAAGRFDEMLARYNAAPAAFQTTDPLTRKRIGVRLTGDDIATILGEAMRETEFLPLVPALVDALADGRKELLRPVVDAAGDALTSHDWGLYYAVQCQDEVPFNTFAAAAGPRLFTGAADAAVCAGWHLPRSSDEAGAVEAPTLVLGGQYDPTTPPESARAAAGDIPSARFAEFAGVGHGVFLASECGRRTISAFLDAPASAASGSATATGSGSGSGSAGAVCDPGAGASAPVRPGDLHLTAAPYRISQSPALIAPFAVFVLVAAAQVVAGLVTLVRRRGGAMRVLAGLAGLAFAGLTALSVTGVPNDIVFAIGLPPAIAWYGLLAAAATVLSITAAFRLRAASADIVPVMTGLVFITWMYGWALA
ncbi:alpha/beta hydrolase [Microtetraspora malaysiensis]|uniref:alpha/beta hydrolase n=1 Tax=Microtetraspora malaysiensis TaxID=161358 RepID=UPI003D92539B